MMSDMDEVRAYVRSLHILRRRNDGMFVAIRTVSEVSFEDAQATPEISEKDADDSRGEAVA